MMLALSFFNSNLFDMFGPLEANQKCPPLFCFLVFIILKLFGYSYYSFRFIPLISSLLSIILFTYISLKWFKSKIAILMGIFIFSFSVPLIYYAQEFKQYSTDVLLCLFLIFIYDYVHFKDLNKKSLILYSISAFLFSILSMPAVFIIPAFICAKFIEEKCINKKSFFIILGYALGTLYFYLLYRKIYTFEKLENEWISGFLTFSFSSVKKAFSDFLVFLVPDFNNNFLFVILLFLIVGLILLLRHNKKQGIFISLTLCAFVIASFLHIYPLVGRLILFMIPIFILLLVTTLDDERFFHIKTIVLSVIIFITLHLSKIPFINIPIDVFLDMRGSFVGRELKLKAINKMLTNVQENAKILTFDELINDTLFYDYFLKFNKKLYFSEVDIFNTPEESQKILDDFLDLITKDKGNESKIILGRNIIEYEEVYPEFNFFENQIENTLNQRKIKYTKDKMRDKNNTYDIYWYSIEM